MLPAAFKVRLGTQQLPRLLQRKSIFSLMRVGKLLRKHIVLINILTHFLSIMSHNTCAEISF